MKLLQNCQLQFPHQGKSINSTLAAEALQGSFLFSLPSLLISTSLTLLGVMPQPP